jgi:CBS domain containing-hemolysin-like protein
VSPVVWAGIAVLILANALYVAAEFAAVGVRRSRVRRLAEDGSSGARRLLPFVETPAALDHYIGPRISRQLMLGAFAQATIAVGLAPVAASLLGLDPASAQSVATVLVLLVLTALQLVVGELVPKAVALQYPTETALATVVPMRWSLVVFRPFLWC